MSEQSAEPVDAEPVDVIDAGFAWETLGDQVDEAEVVDGEVIGEREGPGGELEPYDPDATVDAEVEELPPLEPAEHGQRPSGGASLPPSEKGGGGGSGKKGRRRSPVGLTGNGGGRSGVHISVLGGLSFSPFSGNRMGLVNGSVSPLSNNRGVDASGRRPAAGRRRPLK